jgi:Family of unknown function (DUF5670)
LRRSSYSCLAAHCTARHLGSSQLAGKPINEKVHPMLYTIAVVLLILWLLGLITAYTMGGFIHILLVLAIVMILINLINGRRAL